MFALSEGSKHFFPSHSYLCIALDMMQILCSAVNKKKVKRYAEAISPIAPQVLEKNKSPLHTQKVSNLISKLILSVPDIVLSNFTLTQWMEMAFKLIIYRRLSKGFR